MAEFNEGQKRPAPMHYDDVGQESSVESPNIQEPPIDHSSIVVKEQAEVPSALSAPRKWKDVPFAIVWYITLFGMFIGGITLMIQEKKWDDDDDEDTSLSFEVKAFPIFIGITTSIVFTFIWLAICIFCASIIIKVVLVVTPPFLCAIAIYTLYRGAYVWGILLLLHAAISAWWAYVVWSRIPFATACLLVGVKVLKKYYTPIFINFACGMAANIVVVIDSLVLYGIANIMLSPAMAYTMYFLAMVVVYWHLKVCSNVSHVTTCGVAGSYLLEKDIDGAVSRSLKRALTTSFGSICFGALIEAIIRAILALVKEARRRSGNNMACAVLLCLLECIINCMAWLFEYFNAYTFVYIALYGESYMVSAKAVYAAAKSKFGTAYINDSLVEIPLTCGLLIMLALVFLMVWVVDGWSSNVIIAMMAGWVIYMCVLTTIVSYVQTLLVVWLNTPAEMRQQRPEEFQEITNAWNNKGRRQSPQREDNYE